MFAKGKKMMKLVLHVHAITTFLTTSRVAISLILRWSKVAYTPLPLFLV